MDFILNRESEAGEGIVYSSYKWSSRENILDILDTVCVCGVLTEKMC